ncbi:MAG: hypothetical protein HQK85_07905, partial [Nitrospinae bacterium]|nr:hypothetical protein [Nitrospinota bacterium]
LRKSFPRTNAHNRFRAPWSLRRLRRLKNRVPLRPGNAPPNRSGKPLRREGRIRQSLGRLPMTNANPCGNAPDGAEKGGANVHRLRKPDRTRVLKGLKDLKEPKRRRPGLPTPMQALVSLPKGINLPLAIQEGEGAG